MIISVSFFQSDLTLLSISESSGLSSRLYRKLEWSQCPFLLVEGHCRISDPVFSDWLAQRYPLMIVDYSFRFREHSDSIRQAKYTISYIYTILYIIKHRKSVRDFQGLIELPETCFASELCSNFDQPHNSSNQGFSN